MSRWRALHVLDIAFMVLPGTDEDGEVDPDVLLVLGEDPQGIPLEVMVRRTDDVTVRIFHVMRMRAKYRSLYDRGTR